MKTVEDAVFIDTNVLIYAAFPESPLHALALRRLADLSGRQVWISRQVLREFLAVATRPGSPLPLVDALAAVEDFERRFAIAEDGAAVTTQLLRLMREIGARGKQVHDANVVATLVCYEVPNLLTHNTADFARYSPWVNVLPLEV